MSNPLFNQLGGLPNNPMLRQFMDFKKNFTGDPQQIVQNMVNSGRISQDQVNMYAQQANELYKQFKNFM